MSTLEYSNLRTSQRFQNYLMVHNCNKCTYFTKSLFSIRNHIKSHHTNALVKLFDCSVNAPEPFVCKACNFTTFFTVAFNRHIKKHKMNGKKQSEVCQSEFVSVKMENTDTMEDESDEIIETESKDDENNEIAQQREFITNEIHDPTHGMDKDEFIHSRTRNRTPINETEDDSGIKWYLCTVCPFKSLNKRSVYGHLTVHNETIFSCSHCHFRTKHKRYLKTHITNQHSEMKWFYCGFCPFKAMNKKMLEQHMLDRHTLENMRWFQCDRCLYKTQNKDEFRKHETEHDDDDTVKIKCEDGTFESVVLQKKIVVHGDVYCCSKCPYTTNLKHTLKRHILCKHVDDRNIDWFSCDQCHYKTKTKNCLRIHKFNKHTPPENIKWYCCEQCPYKGKHKGHLQTHHKKHHGIKREVNV